MLRRVEAATCLQRRFRKALCTRDFSKRQHARLLWGRFLFEFRARKFRALAQRMSERHRSCQLILRAALRRRFRLVQRQASLALPIDVGPTTGFETLGLIRLRNAEELGSRRAVAESLHAAIGEMASEGTQAEPPASLDNLSQAVLPKGILDPAAVISHHVLCYSTSCASMAVRGTALRLKRQLAYAKPHNTRVADTSNPLFATPTLTRRVGRVEARHQIFLELRDEGFCYPHKQRIRRLSGEFARLIRGLLEQ